MKRISLLMLLYMKKLWWMEILCIIQQIPHQSDIVYTIGNGSANMDSMHI